MQLTNQQKYKFLTCTVHDAKVVMERHNDQNLDLYNDLSMFHNQLLAGIYNEDFNYKFVLLMTQFQIYNASRRKEEYPLELMNNLNELASELIAGQSQAA